MNKNLWRWTLGSLVVTAPIASVVACSTHTDGLSDEEHKKRLADLTSDEAQMHLEVQWLNMVLKENGATYDEKTPWESAEIMKLIKFYIAEQLNKDSKFLAKIGKKAAGIIVNGKVVYSIEDLRLWGLLDEYIYGYDSSLDDYIDKIAEILMTETSLGFANKIYQNLLINQYLSITKSEFANFRKLQDEREFNFTSIQNLINSGTNFLLVQKILDQKLFFKWEVKEQNAQNRWVDPKYRDQKIEEALEQFLYDDQHSGDNVTIADNSNYNVQRKKLNKQSWDFGTFNITVKYKDEQGQEQQEQVQISMDTYAGYQGISTQANGSGILDFTEPELKKATKDSWIGILQENKDANKNRLVTSGIDFSDIKDARFGKLTFLFGIMPIYLNNELTMNETYFADKLDQVAWQLYANDGKIYEEAMKFYADTKNKGGKDIKIEVRDPAVRAIWKDVKKLIYVR